MASGGADERGPSNVSGGGTNQMNDDFLGRMI